MAQARLLAVARDADRVAREVRRREGPAARHLPLLPGTPAAWVAAVAEAGGRAPRVPVELAEALAVRQRALGAGARAEANARRLADVRAPALAVVTGQQPGLYGGPLLTFHKAAGALHLARAVEAATGRPVVPVFWLASEDHDLEEANQATVLDAAGQPRRAALAVASAGQSLADLDVPVEASDALDVEMRTLLAPTPRAREALALLQRRGAEPFAAWCARALLSVFGDQGLVLLEPRTLLAWMGPPLGLLVREGRRIQDAVRAEGARLGADGLPAPLDPDPTDLPLFERLAPGGPRRRLSLSGAGAPLRDGKPRGGSLEDLARHLEATPLLGSPDVTGRVVVQNALLPVLAYVAGPTELAYLAQVGAAHRALGRPFPLAVPRPSACWMDARSEEVVRDFGRPLAEVLSGPSGAPPAPPTPVEARLGEVRATLEAERRRLADAADVGAQGRQALAAAVDRLLQAWERSEATVRAACAADEGRAASRWARLQNLLFPRGKPQERSLSMLALVARYGLDAVRAGLAALDPLADGLWLVDGDAASHG